MNRRAFLAGTVGLGIGALTPSAPLKTYIPQITIAPDQYIGTQDYFCDIGENAFANFYIAHQGLVICDWHYYNHLGILTFKTGQAVFKGPRCSSWFMNKGHQRVVRLSWALIPPGWRVDGSCV